VKCTAVRTETQYCRYSITRHLVSSSLEDPLAPEQRPFRVSYPRIPYPVRRVLEYYVGQLVGLCSPLCIRVVPLAEKREISARDWAWPSFLAHVLASPEACQAAPNLMRLFHQGWEKQTPTSTPVNRAVRCSQNALKKTCGRISSSLNNRTGPTQCQHDDCGLCCSLQTAMPTPGLTVLDK
jgi:hypothetical protein